MAADSLLEPEFHEHYHGWAKNQKDLAATGKLLTAISPVLDSALRSYGGAQPSPTLRSQAKLMALHAAGSYDPRRSKLRTHLLTQLQGLRRLSARESQIISLPERVSLDLHHLHTATGELADRLGRPPSDIELADHTGLALKRLEHIRRAKPGYAESQFTSQDDEGDTAFQPAVTGNDDAWVRFVYGDLSPTDQFIAERTLGLNGHRPMSKQRIAAQLGLSAGAISQRASRIQSLLDKQQELGSFL